MKTVVWQSLSEEQQDSVLERPAISNGANITDIVTGVLKQVQQEGDVALKALTEKFDKVVPESIRVSAAEIEAASNRLSDRMKQALQQAHKNISMFHQAQKAQPLRVETQPGVVCELVTRSINKVGLYIPGGSAPLPSTVLMLGVPAQIAGCRKVVLCSPPPIADEILYVAKLCNIDEVYNVGGAQAVAAMAYGTETVAKVDKIFGPGNAFVTEAKRQVSNDFRGAAIDIPAGPSEVLVIADETADADFVAADLLSQAEHGPDSQVVLLTPSSVIADQVADALQKQLKLLSRVDIAEQALGSSVIVITESLTQCVTISNAYGPEHLIVQTKNPRELLPLLDNAGSIFLGQWSPESVGDYASGTNHVLPTYGYTRTYSSLGLADFSKRMTVQELSQQGLQGLADTVVTMAEAEGLDAHKRAVTIRIEKLSCMEKLSRMDKLTNESMDK
ncbi:MAG: histidinol dehydrogenase [Vibrio hibernica]